MSDAIRCGDEYGPRRPPRARRAVPSVVARAAVVSLVCLVALGAPAGARGRVVTDPTGAATGASDTTGAARAPGRVTAAEGDSWPNEPCAVDTFTERSGDATAGVDLTRSELRYTCGTGRFALFSRFAGPSESKVAELAWMFDTDRKPTGCRGVDVRVTALYDNGWGVYRITTPTCDHGTWSWARLTSASPFTDSSHAVMRVDAGMLGVRGRPFDWYSIVWSRTSQDASDISPDFWGLTAYYQPSFAITPGDASLNATPDLFGVTDIDGNGLDDVVTVGNGTAPDAIMRRVRGSFRPGPALVVDGTYDAMRTGDFDGDGHGDVFLWGKGDAPDQLLLGAADASLTPATWTQVGGSSDAKLVSGDFNGDGPDDLLLYGPGREPDRVYRGGTLNPVTSKALDVGREFAAVTSTDFNGDGSSDLFFYNPGTGADRLALGGPRFAFTTGPSIRFDLDYETIVSGDFDGDRRDDLVMVRRRAPSGPTAVLSHSMPGRYYSRGVFPPSHAVPLVGRFDVNGTADVIWFKAGPQTDRIWAGITAP